MTSFRVKVSPDVLIWARQSNGLTVEEAAEKIKVFVSELTMWEEGAEEPPIEALRDAARVYKYPFTVMLLPHPPSGIQVLRDYRLLPENQDRDLSPPLRQQFRRIQYQQQVATDLAETIEEFPPAIDLQVALTELPSLVGSRLRSWLMAESSVTSSSFARPGLREWTALVEAKGILVTQIEGVAIEEMRGCSIGSRPFPVIALNGKDSPAGKLFTLIHEVVHVLLNEEALCDLAPDAAKKPTPIERRERFCDQVSAEVLMPASALLDDPDVHRAGPATKWSMDACKDWADASIQVRKRFFYVWSRLKRHPWTSTGRLGPISFSSIARSDSGRRPDFKLPTVARTPI